jgi:ribosomal-protein-alanine N-acetyltransferase
MKVLQTNRLRLVPPSLAHAQDLFEYGKDETFATALRIAPQRSVADAEAFVRTLIEENERQERMYWVAELDNKAVGTLGYIFHGWREYREAEFGYGFSPATWGIGVSSEAAKACLRFGFDELKLARIRFYTRASNQRAQNAVRKLGFRDDLLLENFYSDGEGCQSFAMLALSA